VSQYGLQAFLWPPEKHTATSFMKWLQNNVFNTQYITCNHTHTVLISALIFFLFQVQFIQYISNLIYDHTACLTVQWMHYFMMKLLSAEDSTKSSTRNCKDFVRDH